MKTFATALQAAMIKNLQVAGRTPWAIVDGDKITKIFGGRTEARESKATNNLAGRIVKVAELDLQIVQEPAAVEAKPAKPAKTEKQARAPRLDTPILQESSAERPCKLVWHIADEMKTTRPSATRAEILDACVKRGVAYYTARTQYQQWQGVQKEMAKNAK